MLSKAALLSILPAFVGAAPLDVRAACPNVHVFGARETTAPAGYGSSSTVVNLILAAYPGSTSEAINYPALGGDSYGSSVVAGVAAVASQINTFHTQCPSTLLVLVGYSQGGQIEDDALCGGGDANEGLTSTAVPISSGALAQIKAAIFMGDPRHIPGLPYNVGTSTASGFDPRPAGFVCPSASLIQSYCDQTDPYCSDGTDAATHQGYGAEYGQAALMFVKGKLGAAASGTTGGSTTSGAVAKYGQCGGSGYTGSAACVSGTTCKAVSIYYSQCE